MRVDLDAKVRTRDCEDAGSVERAASDGDAIRLALSREELQGLPTFREIDYGVPPAGWVPPVGFAYPYGGIAWPAAPVAGVIHPATAPASTAPASTSSVYSASDAASSSATTSGSGGAATRHDPDQRSLSKGAVVVDRNGDDVGVVADVRFDPTTGDLRGFVLRVGGMLRTLFGGGETIEIDRDDVQRVDTELVRLTIEKIALERAARQQSAR